MFVVGVFDSNRTFHLLVILKGRTLHRGAVCTALRGYASDQQAYEGSVRDGGRGGRAVECAPTRVQQVHYTNVWLPKPTSTRVTFQWRSAT